MNPAISNDRPTWIGYVRRSTNKQRCTIESQIDIIKSAAAAESANLIDIITETASGKYSDRVGLQTAMALARKHGGIVVVSKYDRLSRDLSFAANLVFHSGVRFRILGDFPASAMTDPLLFGVFYGLAQREVQLISERTKIGRATAIANGKQNGRPDAATSITPEMRAAAMAVRKRNAQENPRNVAAAAAIRRYLTNADNSRTLQAIANHLNAGGFLTSRGVFHTAKSVQLLMKANCIER